MKKIAVVLLAALTIFAVGCSHQPAVSSVPDSSSGADSLAGTGFFGEDALESELADSAVSSAPPVSSAASSQAQKSASPAPESEQPTTVSITIPEGFTAAQIAARLEANKVCSAADFIKMAQTYDFSYYPLVKAIPSSQWRAYKLEGYLYPDTYQMYLNMKPQDAVGKFLRDAEESISGNYRYSGMTTDSIVTLASLIEREATDLENMKLVSSVFHNRLKSGQRLEADATIDYCNLTLFKANPPFSDDFKYHYNTYRFSGLPAGPICNPGANALRAAASPASTDYYYYCTANGKYYYQKTLEAHNAKLEELGLG